MRPTGAAHPIDHFQRLKDEGWTGNKLQRLAVIHPLYSYKIITLYLTHSFILLLLKSLLVSHVMHYLASEKKKIVPKKINDNCFIYVASRAVVFFTLIYLVYCQNYYIWLFTLHTVCSFFPSFSITFYKDLTL